MPLKGNILVFEDRIFLYDNRIFFCKRIEFDLRERIRCKDGEENNCGKDCIPQCPQRGTEGKRIVAVLFQSLRCLIIHNRLTRYF